MAIIWLLYIFHKIRPHFVCNLYIYAYIGALFQLILLFIALTHAWNCIAVQFSIPQSMVCCTSYRLFVWKSGNVMYGIWAQK